MKQEKFSRRKTKKQIEIEELREEETQLTEQQKNAQMLYKKSR
jgi:FtsZ-binding cell division protein ZapB